MVDEPAPRANRLHDRGDCTRCGNHICHICEGRQLTQPRSDTLIGWLFHSDVMHVNKFASQPAENPDEDDADHGENNGNIIARRAMPFAWQNGVGEKGPATLAPM